jgi:hypothetical protein
LAWNCPQDAFAAAVLQILLLVLIPHVESFCSGFLGFLNSGLGASHYWGISFSEETLV